MSKWGKQEEEEFRAYAAEHETPLVSEYVNAIFDERAENAGRIGVYVAPRYSKDVVASVRQLVKVTLTIAGIATAMAAAYYLVRRLG